MFSLQPRDELVFGTPTASEQDKFLMSDPLVESHTINLPSKRYYKQLGRTTKLGFPRRRQTGSRDGCNIQKVKRRDIERKRRQEMSSLYVCLRSLLPLDHIKGKRSMSDQMDEAVNYIKHMQKNIEELRIRRDKLKELSKLSGKKVESSNDSDNLPNCVAVNLVSNGVEILITCSIKSEFGLSPVLAELMERELDVVSCVSTRTNGRFLHKIQAEARDMASFDVLVLQEKLSNAIN